MAAAESQTWFGEREHPRRRKCTYLELLRKFLLIPWLAINSHTSWQSVLPLLGWRPITLCATSELHMGGYLPTVGKKYTGQSRTRPKGTKSGIRVIRKALWIDFSSCGFANVSHVYAVEGVNNSAKSQPKYICPSNQMPKVMWLLCSNCVIGGKIRCLSFRRRYCRQAWRGWCWDKMCWRQSRLISVDGWIEGTCIMLHEQM
jgi:hypothetical protein